MSRPKSAAAIQRARDRAARVEERERKRAEKQRDKLIRTERRERKKAERDAKRKERERKRLTHESIVRNNGISSVKASVERFGLREAMDYSPFRSCDKCNIIIRDREMTDNLCDSCHYEKETAK